MEDHDWPVLESAVEYDTSWYRGGYDLVEQPDGSTKRYYWASLPPAVVVVAITDDREVVFVEQYRPTVRETQLELVAGIVDEHEGDPAEPVDPADYEAAARRELREETGYRADDLEYVESFATTTGLLRHRRGFVVAEGLEAGEVDRDQNEFLSVTTVPEAEVVERAREPPTNDATVEGVLLAKEDGYLDP